MENGLATSSTSENDNTKQSKRHTRFRMNLRLYSDTKQLATIAETLKFPRMHLHIKGEPMFLTGPLAGKISEKHYVSFMETKTQDANDIAPWIEETAAAIAAVPEIVEDSLETSDRDALDRDVWRQ